MFLTTDFSAHWARTDDSGCGKIVVDLDQDEYNECIATIENYGSGYEAVNKWTEWDGILFTALKVYLRHN